MTDPIKAKRKDECEFCTSRSCHHQIYRDQEPKYDQVHCFEHIEKGELQADEILGGKGSGMFRTHRSSTGKLTRGSR